MVEINSKLLTKETLEKMYSKKQLSSVIDSFHISPIRNSKFKEIISMFPNQTNYQIWAIKCLWNRFLSMNEIKSIKELGENNHQLIKKLIKQNIVSYSTYEEIRQLFNEIKGLNRFLIVKNTINKFNTTQRKLMSDALKIDSANGLDYINDSLLIDAYSKFSAFNKLIVNKQNNFITKASAMCDFNEIWSQIDNCLKDTWSWDKDELLEYIQINHKDIDVVFNENNVVLAKISSYESSKKFGGGGRTQWCISFNESQWKNYVGNYDGLRTQYFMFDFNKPEQDDTCMVAFTVDKKGGIIHAHSLKDSAITSHDRYNYNGKTISVFDLLKGNNIPFKTYLEIGKPAYNWNKESFKEYFKNNKNSFDIIVDKKNMLLIRIISNDVFKVICNHTFISNDNEYYFDDLNNKNFILLDFNKNYDDEDSLVFIKAFKDDYNTEKLDSLVNNFGIKVDKSLLKNFDISEKEFLTVELNNPSILLHKYLDEANEVEALNLIKNNPDIDVNFLFNDRIPMFIATQNNLYKVANAIMEHPSFNGNTKDGYGELVSTDLMFLYMYAENEDDKQELEHLLVKILTNNQIDLSLVNDNNDTLLITAFYGNVDSNRTNWYIEELLGKENININAINEIGEDALTLAIKKGNLDIIKQILGRRDLIVSDGAKAAAKEFNIDLDGLKPKEEKKDVTITKFNNKEITVNEVIEKMFS